MDRLATLFGRHRLLLAFVVVAYTGVSLFGITRLKFHHDPLELMRSDRVEFKRLGERFGHLERTALIVVEGEDLLAPEGIDAIRGLANAAPAVEGVEAVYSMLHLRGSRRVGRYFPPLLPSAKASPERRQRALNEAESHPLLIGHLLSADRKTALVIVQFEDRIQGVLQFKPVLAELQSLLDRCAGATGLRFRLTGSAPLEVEIVENMIRDIRRLIILGAAIGMGITLAMFRRLGAVILVDSGPFVGVIWTMGTLGLIGEPINVLTNIVPLLVLVVGFTDSIHLVMHVRRALDQGATPQEAAQASIRHLGLACALTSLSTAVGFGSLILAGMFIIRIFGWCCALGSVMSFLAVITVVPLLAGTRLARYVPVPATPGRRSPAAPVAEAVLGGILHRPRTVLAGGIALTLALAAITTRLEPDHTIASEVPASSQTYRALQHVEDKFGGVMFAYAVVEWPEGRGLESQEFYDVLGEVHQAMDSSHVLSNPLSLLNLVRSLPGRQQSFPQRARELRYLPQEVLQRFVSLEDREAVVSVHMPDAGARVLRPAYIELDRQLEEIAARHPGFQVELTGASVSVFRSIHLMIEDLWKSLGTAAGVMFLMICVGLRSLRYALISVMPNVFPLLCTSAFIVLSGRHLEMSSVIVFSISLGIAVDDTIHFLVRYRREIEIDGDPRRAVRRTFRIVGVALVMTTVILVAGHGVVMLSAFPAVRTYGLLTAVTVASALVGDLVLLPAILVSLRWPKSPSDESSS